LGCPVASGVPASPAVTGNALSAKSSALAALRVLSGASDSVDIKIPSPPQLATGTACGDSQPACTRALAISIAVPMASSSKDGCGYALQYLVSTFCPGNDFTLEIKPLLKCPCSSCCLGASATNFESSRIISVRCKAVIRESVQNINTEKNNSAPRLYRSKRQPIFCVAAAYSSCSRYTPIITPMVVAQNRAKSTTFRHSKDVMLLSIADIPSLNASAAVRRRHAISHRRPLTCQAARFRCGQKGRPHR
jgi:hypothetical protein